MGWQWQWKGFFGKYVVFARWILAPLNLGFFLALFALR